MRCHFIPDYLLDKVASSDDEEVSRCGHHTRSVDAGLRARRTATGAVATPTSTAAWQVFTADGGSDLPGTLARSAGDPEAGDTAVDEAATGVGETLELFDDLGRSSYDDKGAPVLATVHYEKDYDNAFWDGNQLVCGDGDGKVFGRFTGPIDVLGHELSHAVTQYTANFTYSGQSGALNESVSDCFGSCVKQRHLGQQAADADWLIGEGIFLAGIQGVALRSMKAPGTAYDDPAIGKDPQVASMSDYVQTTDDDGGVHLNSGIPNRAFYLAATAIGGTSWEGAGRIWYAALTSGISTDADFAAFAAATVAAAGEHADAVASAWHQVGVSAVVEEVAQQPSRNPQQPSRNPQQPSQDPDTLEVVRAGGVGGVTRRGTIDLSAEDDRAREARELLARNDLSAVGPGEARPDRFVYEFRCAPQQVRVHEGALTPDLKRLAELALG